MFSLCLGSLGDLLKPHRDGERLLVQLLVLDEGLLACMSLELALMMSVPLVHTASRLPGLDIIRTDRLIALSCLYWFLAHSTS